MKFMKLTDASFHMNCCIYAKLIFYYMDRVKRIWYLLPMRAAKVQASMRIQQSRRNLRCSLIQAVCQEEPSDRKPDPWPLWMAGHAQLKFVMTECSKTHIHLTGPIKSLQRIIAIDGNEKWAHSGFIKATETLCNNWCIGTQSWWQWRINCLHHPLNKLHVILLISLSLF